MPIFQPRNRIQILRDMVSRVIARSALVGLTRNSVVFHILAGAATEDAEQYLQLARLRTLFSIDKAKGSDLDERAKDIQPSTMQRRGAMKASGTVTFSRPGTAGSVTINAGTIVAAQDARGLIKFRTTASGTINAGTSSVSGVPVTALEAGARGNVAGGAIAQFVTRVPGVTTVTNPVTFTSGRDRESDEEFVARLKRYVAALSRGTPRALESFARNAFLDDGRRVLFAKCFEPITPNGRVTLYIDDGTGAIEQYDDTHIATPETLVAAAAGGETDLYTTEWPIRDDGSFELRIAGVLQTRDTHYYLNTARGHIELATPLTVGQSVTARYRYFTGLIQETQKIIDGDPTNPTQKPGVRAAGIQVYVAQPQAIYQTLVANIAVLDGYTTSVVAGKVKTEIQQYINSLDIGEDVIVAELIERAMSVDGMFNFTITSLSGGAAADQIILTNQVARITDASITLT